MHRLRILLFIIVIWLSCKPTERGTKKKIESEKLDTMHKMRELKIPDGALLWTRSITDNTIALSPYVAKHIAPKHVPLDTALGDANKDGILDLLLVTCNQNETQFRHSGKLINREMLLFLGAKDGSYRFVCRNRNAIPPINGGGQGDPFGGISVKSGSISITEYISSNCKSISRYTFRFLNKQSNWYLDNIINESFCFDYQDYTRDTTLMTKSKRVAINRFDIVTETE